MILKIYIYALLLLTITGCAKNDIKAPDSNVTVGETSYKLGDTIHFKFSGDPESIIFYSGTPGNDYSYKDRIHADGKPQLNFSTYLQNAGEINTMTLLISKDFNGKYDPLSVKKANWVDLTSRAKLSTGGDNTASGIIDLSEFATSTDPVYFALKYQGYQSTTLRQPTWTIRTFNINNVLSEGRTAPIATIDQIGWVPFDYYNPTIAWTVPVSGIVSINGTAPASTNETNEDWLVSRGFNLKSVNPDIPNSNNGYIKNLGEKSISDYYFKYTAAGTYLASFEAFNSGIEGKKTIVRQIKITITP